MQKAPLKIFQENVNGKELFITYYTLYENAINQQPQGGIKVDEMAKRMRILIALEAFSEDFNISESEYNKMNNLSAEERKAYQNKLCEREAEFELEDADFKKLQELVKEAKWGIVSKGIFAFCQYFDDKL